MSQPGFRRRRELAVFLVARAVRLGRRLVRPLLVAVAIYLVFDLATRPARAAAVDDLHQLGRTLLGQAGALAGARTWIVNGAEVEVETHSSDRSIEESLRAATQDCPADSVLRDVGPDAGFAACLTGAAGLLGEPSDVVGRIRGLLGSFDADAVGLTRYVYAVSRDGHTSAISLAARTPLSAATLLGDGEAPGEDLAGLPRPAGLERAFSFREVGLPYGFAVYRDAERGPAELERAYARALAADGWHIYERAGGDGTDRADEAGADERLIAVRSGEMVVLVTFRREAHSVAALALGAAGRSQ